MHVVLDARKLGDGGIGVYLENLIAGLLEVAENRSSKFFLSILVESEKAVTGSLRNCLDRFSSLVQIVEDRTAKYSFSEYFLLPLRHRRLLKSASLFHSPHYTLPFFLPLPAVLTVHDCIHVTHPDTVLHQLLGRYLLRSALKRATRIIAVSEASRRSLSTIFSLSRTQSVVIPNALREEFWQLDAEDTAITLAETALAPGYFLFVGSERPHKGFRRLLLALRLLRDARATESIRLVAVGSRFGEAAQRWIKEFDLDEQVTFVGAVSTAHLVALYDGARAVCIPSDEEGFGIMVLEAFSRSVPIVATPVPALLELAGPEAWFAHDFSPAAFSAAVIEMLEHDEERKRRVASGRVKVQKFSRQEIAQQTMNIYEQIMNPAEVRA